MQQILSVITVLYISISQFNILYKYVRLLSCNSYMVISDYCKSLGEL